MSNVATPDPLLEYRKVLAHATEVAELGAVDDLSPDRPRSRATGRLSPALDRLPIHVVLQGGVTLNFRVTEWLPEPEVRLDLK